MMYRIEKIQHPITGLITLSRLTTWHYCYLVYIMSLVAKALKEAFIPCSKK